MFRHGGSCHYYSTGSAASECSVNIEACDAWIVLISEHFQPTQRTDEFYLKSIPINTRVWSTLAEQRC